MPHLLTTVKFNYFMPRYLQLDYISTEDKNEQNGRCVRLGSASGLGFTRIYCNVNKDGYLAMPVLIHMSMPGSMCV